MANSGKITKIEFVSEGFKAIFASEGCRELVEEKTNEIADRANANNTRGGEGFASSVIYGSKAGRYIGFVSTTDNQSKIAESEDSALSRAVT